MPNLLTLLLAAPLAIPTAANAHSNATPQHVAASAIAIPDVTHGEMAVLAQYAGTIRAVAAGQNPTDPTFRRLANFAELQRTYCLWSIVPGSISDEASPFNECSHAYLAALKAALLHMRKMPHHDPAVDSLADAIELSMLRSGATLVLCRYSRETFSTAALVVPEWRTVLSHPPSLLAIGGALAAGGLATGLATGALPRRRSAAATAPAIRL